MTNEKKFYLKNGKTFSNLEKFAKELIHMGDEVFNHHVNAHKHDFKEWVRHSLNKEGLATKLEVRLDKLEVELEVLRYLVHDANKPQKKAKAIPKKVSKTTSKTSSTKKPIKKPTSPKKKEAKSSLKKTSKTTSKTSSTKKQSK